MAKVGGEQSQRDVGCCGETPINVCNVGTTARGHRQIVLQGKQHVRLSEALVRGSEWHTVDLHLRVCLWPLCGSPRSMDVSSADVVKYTGRG